MKLSLEKTSPAGAEAITALLDLATLDLLRKGVQQWSYPWDKGLLESEIALGRVYHATLDDKIVGTFSLGPLLQKPWIPGQNQVPSLYLYRVALLPSCQGMKLGRQLVDAACQIASEQKSNLYLDCWAGNQSLISFYQSAGFDTIGIFPEENYEIAVFFKKFVQS